MDEPLAAALSVLERADADPLAVAAACEAVVAWAQARELEALHAVSLEQPPVIDPTGLLCDPAPAEVATTLHWSTGTAMHRLDLAADLCNDLPGVLDALRTGMIDLPKAQEIARGTCGLDAGERTVVADRAIGYGGSHNRAQLRAWLVRAVAAINPDAVQRRRRKALTERRVWVTPETDGMATIGAYVTAEEAQACWKAITCAAANIEGKVDPARADALIALLTGTAVGTPVSVHVVITPDGPELAGHGPISLSHFGELREITLIDLQPPTMTIGYRPCVSLARWVRNRDRHCRFPGCRQPASACDLDHVIPWPAGRTQESNWPPCAATTTASRPTLGGGSHARTTAFWDGPVPAGVSITQACTIHRPPMPRLRGRGLVSSSPGS